MVGFGEDANTTAKSKSAVKAQVDCSQFGFKFTVVAPRVAVQKTAWIDVPRRKRIIANNKLRRGR